MDTSRLSDDELWNRTKSIVRAEHATVYDLVEHLAEIDRRHLSEKRVSLSLFDFCVHQLHLSEDAAYRRIRAARAIRKFPPISALLRDGRLTIEAVSLLHPHLEDPDAATLVKKCIGLRKWQVQALLAERQGETPRRDVIRYVGKATEPSAAPPEASSSGSSLLDWTVPSAPIGAPQKSDVPAPEPTALPPPSKAAVSVSASIRVSFTADADFHALLRRAQALLWHKYPDGRLEGVLKDALVALLGKKIDGFEWQPSKSGRISGT